MEVWEELREGVLASKRNRRSSWYRWRLSKRPRVTGRPGLAELTCWPYVTCQVKVGEQRAEARTFLRNCLRWIWPAKPLLHLVTFNTETEIFFLLPPPALKKYIYHTFLFSFNRPLPTPSTRDSQRIKELPSSEPICFLLFPRLFV